MSMFVEEGWAYRSAGSNPRHLITAAIAPSARAVHYPARALPLTPMTADELMSAVQNALVVRPKGLIFSLSHDHYLTVAGGVQNCVGDEQAWASSNDWAYLHICPNAPVPLLGANKPASDTEFIVSLDGERLGVVAMPVLTAILAQVHIMPVDYRMVVHHLLGFAPEHVARIWESCKRPDGLYVWTHDLFTLCPSIHLLRNDVTFCESPPPDSQACMICNAGDERAEHTRRLRHFFATTQPRVLSPSATLLEFWQAKGGYEHASAEVIPPCRLCSDDHGPTLKAGRPLRVGFMGAPVYSKGWPVFEELARWFSRDDRYQFYHFGWQPVDVPNLNFIKTSVSRDDRDAMVRAAREAELDVLINWSQCYESFSFTTHEALAAGAYVIVRKGAGHAARAVETEYADRGCTVKTSVELNALFEGEGMRALLRTSTRRYGRVVAGHGVGHILGEAAHD
jgi:hypothetical protein